MLANECCVDLWCGMGPGSMSMDRGGLADPSFVTRSALR